MGPKPKPSSAMVASQPPTTVEDLFETLNMNIRSDSFDNTVKLADQILAVAPADKDALRCKVVALIKDDRIDRAISVIQSSRTPPPDFDFLKAYCLYRQNKLDEALESLKRQKRRDKTILLEAQIMHCLGRIDACLDLYRKLDKYLIDGWETNNVAWLVMDWGSFNFRGSLDSHWTQATSSFELAYNTACYFIEMTKYRYAEQLLLLGRRVGQEFLTEENLCDNEIEIELSPIAVQLAYVQQLLGRKQDAMEAYTEIITRGKADELSFAVAVNNLVSLRGPKDISDSLRKLDWLKDKETQRFQLARGLDSKLSTTKREAIYANRVLLLLHANKMGQARELVSRLLDMFPKSVMPLQLQAALLVKENKTERAEEILAQSAGKFTPLVYLPRAQVAAAAGHPHIAADSLAKIQFIQHMPAMVATLVSLKERAGDIEGAAAVLDSAINWWSNARNEKKKLNIILQAAALFNIRHGREEDARNEKKKLNIILQAAVSFNIRHGREEDAARLSEELVKSQEGIEGLAGLVITVARMDVDKAELYVKQLKTLPGLEGIDVDSLERTFGVKQVDGPAHVGVAETNDEGNCKTKAKKTRKRKPRYPKGFDPANPGPPPDPERWLPKQERSTYRPKRKDKRVAQVREQFSGRKGSSVPAQSELDFSATRKENRKLVNSDEGNGVNSGSRGSKSESAGKKKKSGGGDVLMVMN